MNRKLGLGLIALLAVVTIVSGTQPAAAVEKAQAPVSLEELFASPSTSAPALANGQDGLFVTQALGCTNQFCTSTLHCQQICGDPAVACVSQLGTKRCIYL